MQSKGTDEITMKRNEQRFTNGKVKRKGEGIFDVAHYRKMRPYGAFCLDKILSYIPSYIPLIILDGGCGTGVYGIWIKMHRPESEICGIDISSKAVKEAHRISKVSKLNISYIQDDI